MIYIAKVSLGEEEKAAVNAVMDSGMIACGDVVKHFEEEFSKYIGADYGIATTSGTTALEVALRSLGIGPGDKVLTTPYSFIASTNAILYVGATPVFADIDENTFTLDFEQVEKCLNEQSGIKALLIVHLFGRPCDMDRIQAIVKKYNIMLIEDCAQAHGATWNNKRIGSFGDAAAFSFYPTKNMTTGEGGMVLTNHSYVAENARLLISHGMKVRYYHESIGFNYRMTNIAAAIGLCQLAKLPTMNNNRYKNAAYYMENITNDQIIKPGLIEGHVYHQFTLRIRNYSRDRFIDHMNRHQIGSGIFYPLSIPEQECYKKFHFQSNFTVTDRIKNEVVSIPVHPFLSEEELARVTGVINDFTV
ncbi:DegT/DnrJ/EryC1/StrS family aminotransferase [Paenibacillus silviterrae]|uniref:DegT/DnrJ/EryC1/StrS family aminotransferase n=1 Tax=Paenibacillus silviterrae TaxID=3242194 RepID=UPI002543C169|nr:DegT/DnrJ/EryC1/StrS family aminotransferase [Paenibacillus chinjuensis]